MRTVLVVLAVAGSMFGQELGSLNPDRIKAVQEREAHERAVAERIEYQLAQQPKPVAQPAPPVRHLSAKEMKELCEALDRYFREHPGQVPIFWTPPAR